MTDRAGRWLHPEYLLRPAQLWWRWRAGAGPRDVRLPWDLVVPARDDGAVGSALLRSGVYDLPLSEVLWRLTAAGDTCVDGGANIGYATSLLAVRAGRQGRVIAVEAHPALANELRSAVGRWAGTRDLAQIQVLELALDDAAGLIRLAEGAAFAANRGTASIARDATPGGAAYEVTACRLDGLPGIEAGIGVLKLDVEGAELRALHGAASLLAAGRIRDIVYEEHDQAGPVRALLQRHGYRVSALSLGWRGPRWGAPRTVPLPVWLPPNFLATLEPQRADELLRPRGWRCLRP